MCPHCNMMGTTLSDYRNASGGRWDELLRKESEETNCKSDTVWATVLPRPCLLGPTLLKVSYIIRVL
jgi:hypothetical protein